MKSFYERLAEYYSHEAFQKSPDYSPIRCQKLATGILVIENGRNEFIVYYDLAEWKPRFEVEWFFKAELRLWRQLGFSAMQKDSVMKSFPLAKQWAKENLDPIEQAKWDPLPVQELSWRTCRSF